MAVLELIADMAILFEKVDVYRQYFAEIFMTYLTQTAASVRKMGVHKAAKLAECFKNDWVMQDFLPLVKDHYSHDRKGYNYRMCCLYSMQAVMPFMTKDQISQQIIPTFIKACKDDIPNVKFCVARILSDNKHQIDPNVFSNQLLAPLKEMSNDADKDVAHFAKVALSSV